MTQLGQQIAARPFAPKLLDLAIPSQSEVVGAINDLRDAAGELKRTWMDAREFGFTVEAEDLKGLAELGVE